MRSRFSIFSLVVAMLLIIFLVSSCSVSAQHKRKSRHHSSSSNAKDEWIGMASFYANKFEGKKTASGDIFKNNKMTAACNKLPLGTKVKVTNLDNGKSVQVIVNDRLHASNKRLIDLTTKAAKKLGYIEKGLTKVKVELEK